MSDDAAGERTPSETGTDHRLNRTHRHGGSVQRSHTARHATVPPLTICSGNLFDATKPTDNSETTTLGVRGFS